MNLTDQLRAKLAPKTPKQQDVEHSAWRDTNEGLVEIIKLPVLGIPPSRRTIEDNRDVLIHKIKGWRNEKP